ncbi:MAG TPA: diguanylate cyclase [Baekduia sp.]|nr:diguanylate cyclase [Baekduia sp.]
MPAPLAAALGLAVGLVLSVAVVWHGALGRVDEWALPLLFAITTASCAWRVARVPAGRLPWALMAAGVGTYTAGSILYNILYSADVQPPFPSISDYLWSVVQPAAIWALLIHRRRHRAGGRAELLDGALCALALAGICAALVYEPIFSQVLDRGVAFGFLQPLLDLAVVATVLMRLSTTGWQADRLLALFGVSFLALSVGDGLYVVDAATSGYDAGTWLDLPYAICMTGLALAAWTVPLPPRPAAPGVRSLAIPIAAGLIGVGLATVALVTDLNPVAEVAIVLLLLTLVARAGMAMRDYGALLATKVHEAGTDSLTGLPNRRRLVEDLSRRPRARRTLALFDLDGFKSYNDTFGHTAGDALLARLGGMLGDAAGDWATAYRMGGDEFCVVADTRHAHAVIAACAAALRDREGDVEISSSWGVVVMPDEASSFAQALGIADRRMYAMKNGRPRSAGSQLRDVLVRVLDIREPDLHDHVVDVGRLAGGVARRLGLPEHEITDIVHGAVLHDVGKLAVPAEILDKPGPLDDAEWEVMRRHTIEGEQFLAGIPALANVARLVRSSHERWDGGGYPDGLAGTEIPLGARIITVCDAYDAMVTDRPYRRGMPREAALAELRRCAGSHFDAQVVAAFCAMVEDEERASARPSLVA